MIEITILGTACMQPTKERNHVGILLGYKNENILFDCGENTQRQLRIINFKPAKITKIFISHWHGDHVLGLPGLMSTMGADQFAKKLQIYGPKGTKEHIKYMLKAFLSKQIIDYEVIEIAPEKKGIKTLEFADFFVEAAQLDHSAPCLGYSFKEKDRRKIVSKYIKTIPGILLGELQRGKTITYQNKKISPEEATYLIKGKKVSIIMDTKPCGNFLKLAEKADLLISEATYLQQHQDKSEEYYHMTAQEVGLLANQAQVKKLVLLHFSPRYKNVKEIEEEAKNVFKNAVCAHDFMRFKL